MFRPLLLVLIVLMALLTACDNADNNDSDTSNPTAPPSVSTSVIASSRFNGPVLNSNTSSEAEASCAEGSDCGLSTATDVEAALALPLTPTTWQGLSIGVPEDFEAIDYEANLSVETTDAEAQPGSFRVALRWTDAAGAERLVNSYANLDIADRSDHPNALGAGYIIPNGDVGIVGVWTLEDGRVVIVEGFVQPGYWPRYAATYLAMVDSLAVAQN